jgi:hypothetical protein
LAAGSSIASTPTPNLTSDLKAFAEAIAVLTQAADAVGRDARQFQLFLLGTGNGFRRPTDPVDPSWRQLPH